VAIPSEQKPGIHSTADNLGAQLPGRLCACRDILCYPKKQAKKGHFFHARPAEKQLLGGWTGFPLVDGPFPRLLRNVGGSRLAQGNYFGGRIAEATPASHLTQGRSNEDIPMKQCSCFNKSSTFFSHQLGHALAHSCKM